MYPWGKIKDETINFIKSNYIMILATCFIAGFVISFATGILSGVLSVVQMVASLCFAGLTTSDNSVLAIIGTICTYIVSFVVSIFASGIAYFVTGIGMIGVSKTFEKAKLTGVIDLNNLLFPFQSNFKNIAMVELKKSLTITLWSLLCVIPGMIKLYEYYMVDFLLADNPNLSAEQAMSISKQTTSGDKLNIFLTVLVAGFIVGLGFIACCVGQFFLLPVTYVVQYEVYLYLRAKAIGTGIVDESYLVSM